MIYEIVIVLKPELAEDHLSEIKGIVKNVVAEHNGEIFVDDDWGTVKLAQAINTNLVNAHFLYYIYKANSHNNTELIRRLQISEHVLRNQIFKVGEDGEEGVVVKNYKTPFSKKYAGSATDKEDESEKEKGRKRFYKRRTCWFSANQIMADWKDPETYSWVLNEFGKISPARVTNISCKHQRYVATQIKRARQLGIASFVSNKIARKLS